MMLLVGYNCPSCKGFTRCLVGDSDDTLAGYAVPLCHTAVPFEQAKSLDNHKTTCVHCNAVNILKSEVPTDYVPFRIEQEDSE